MLPLLRHRLILAVLVGSSLASAEGDSSWIDVGIGYDVEAFHWHETVALEYVGYPGGTYTVLNRGERRFLTENGYRGIPHAELRLRPVPGMRLSGRFGYVMGSVDYDGGLQPSDEGRKTWPLDSVEVDGTSYYRYSDSASTSVTGWFGPAVSIGVQLRSAPPRTGGYFTAADIAWDWRSLTRKLNYTTTRASGYDEIWSLSQLRASVGPGWKNGAGSFRGYLGVSLPLSSSEELRQAGSTWVPEITLEPQPRLGWFAGAVWESSFGLEIGLRWEKQTWDESDAVTVTSRLSDGSVSRSGLSQPRTVESALRLETAWLF